MDQKTMTVEIEDKVGEEQEQKNGNASGQSRMNAPAQNAEIGGAQMKNKRLRKAYRPD